MTDIREFLTARFAEDKSVALEVFAGLGDNDAEPVSLSGSGQLVVGDRAIPTATTNHMLRWSPNRVLAEVAAKSRILDEMDRWRHEAVQDGWYSCSQAVQPDCPSDMACVDEDRVGKPCDCGLDARRDRLARALAAPYRSEPDFNPAWEVA